MSGLTWRSKTTSATLNFLLSWISSSMPKVRKVHLFLDEMLLITEFFKYSKFDWLRALVKNKNFFSLRLVCRRNGITISLIVRSQQKIMIKTLKMFKTPILETFFWQSWSNPNFQKNRAPSFSYNNQAWLHAKNAFLCTKLRRDDEQDLIY